MNKDEKTHLMNRIFLEAKVCPDHSVSEKFEIYCNMLLKCNERFNLTSITDEKEIYRLHFLDCAMGAKFFPENSTVCDIGSGAGFPGVVIALLRKDISVTLIDSLKKRTDFLKSLTAELGIKSTCIHMRAEDLNSDLRETFDIATARAVAPLDTLMEYTLPFVKTGGSVIAYKGPSAADELSRCDNALKLLGNCTFRSFGYSLDEFTRNIIIIDKHSRTPEKYPRHGNKPRSTPL